MVKVETIIDAPPATVRAIFLDLPNLRTWHSGSWVSSVESRTPGKSTANEMVKGDKIVSKAAGMQFHQIIQENTPEILRWIGPWYGLLTGEHAFEWQAIDGEPNKTRLVQWEHFTGPLAFYMRDDWPGGKKTASGFQAINQDLKRHAESVHLATAAAATVSHDT